MKYFIFFSLLSYQLIATAQNPLYTEWRSDAQYGITRETAEDAIVAMCAHDKQISGAISSTPYVQVLTFGEHAGDPVGYISTTTYVAYCHRITQSQVNVFARYTMKRSSGFCPNPSVGNLPYDTEECGCSAPDYESYWSGDPTDFLQGCVFEPPKCPASGSSVGYCALPTSASFNNFRTSTTFTSTLGETKEVSCTVEISNPSQSIVSTDGTDYYRTQFNGLPPNNSLPTVGCNPLDVTPDQHPQNGCTSPSQCVDIPNPDGPDTPDGPDGPDTGTGGTDGGGGTGGTDGGTGGTDGGGGTGGTDGGGGTGGTDGGGGTGGTDGGTGGTDGGTGGTDGGTGGTDGGTGGTTGGTDGGTGGTDGGTGGTDGGTGGTDGGTGGTDGGTGGTDGGTGGTDGGTGDGDGDGECTGTDCATATSGVCGTPPSCAGDPVQCALLIQSYHLECSSEVIITECDTYVCKQANPVLCEIGRQQWQSNCSIDLTPEQEADPNSLLKFKSGVDDGLDFRGGENVDGSIINMEDLTEDLDSSGRGFSRSCITDLTVNLPFVSFTIPISKWCPVLQLAGSIVLFFGYFLAIRIVGRGL